MLFFEQYNQQMIIHLISSTPDLYTYQIYQPKYNMLASNYIPKYAPDFIIETSI